MPKKRTRKQKIKARHHFAESLVNPQITSKAEGVKWQFKNSPLTSKSKDTRLKNANRLDKDVNLGTIKKNLIKSLIIVSFILALELVIYLVWI